MAPQNLILIRHGQSEFNKFIHELRDGTIEYSDLSQETLSRKGSKWRLTNLGIEQAKSTGLYIKNHLDIDEFHGYFVSDYIRAKETAIYLNIPDARWQVEPYLRERDWGDVGLKDFVERNGTSLFKHENAFYGSPASGESIANLCLRVDRVLDTINREYSNKNVIIVCHGELMWGFRVRLEGLLEDDFINLDKSKHPHDRIHNGQIIQYQQYDDNYLNRMRSIHPHDTSLSNNDWFEIRRMVYTNEDLNYEVTKYNKILIE